MTFGENNAKKQQGRAGLGIIPRGKVGQQESIACGGEEIRSLPVKL